MVNTAVYYTYLMNWIVPLSLLVVFEITADIFAKEWSLKQTPLIWVFAIGSYVLGNMFWLYALKNGLGLGKGALIFAIVTAIIAIIIGVYFYKESVNRVQMIGIVLGLVSLVLILWE